ncbi:hypothetical protein GCM10023192_22100 [Amycolatopsis samaneae]
MLSAVAAGRALVSLSCEPDLFVDGLPCSDQETAHRLAHAGLIRPARTGRIGDRVPAALTRAGRAALAVPEPGGSGRRWRPSPPVVVATTG